MIMWLYGYEPITLGHHAVNFGGFRQYGSGDNTFLICHMNSKEHVFKGFCDFMGQSPLKSPSCIA